MDKTKENTVSDGRYGRRWIFGIGGFFVAGGLLSACFAAWSISEFGSIRYGLMYLQGQRVVLEPETVSLGEVTTSNVSTHFVCRNLSRSAVELLGARADCSCVVVEELPTIIEGKGTRNIPIAIKLSEAAGAFGYRILLYSNANDDFKVLGRIVGNASIAGKE